MIPPNIDMPDNFMVDPETGRIRSESIGLNYILVQQIGQIVRVSDGLHNFTSLDDFQNNIDMMRDCMRTAEALVSGYLDDQYSNEKKEIMERKAVLFEEEYKEWIARGQEPDEIDSNKRAHNLNIEADKCAEWFVAFMGWIKRSGLGFERDMVLDIGRPPMRKVKR